MSGAQREHCFKMVVEKNEFYNNYRAQYVERLSRLDGPPLMKEWEQLTTKERDLVFSKDEAGYPNYKPTPLSPMVFWKIIRSAGIRFVVDHKPHDCEIHLQGPGVVDKLGEVIRKLAGDGLSIGVRRTLTRDVAKYEAKKENFERHLRQYEV